MRVLVADDDPTIRELLDIYSRDQPFDLIYTEDGRRAVDIFKSQGADCVVTDIRMPLASGEDVLRGVHAIKPSVPVLILTAHASIEDAVRLLRMGAADYITKPVSKEVFNHRVMRALEAVRLAQEVSRLRLESSGMTHPLIGTSPAMTRVLAKLPLTAQTDATVIIYGESGTGKELVAQTLHRLSKRAERPFITVNCGALPDTLLESELFGYMHGAFTDAKRDTPGLVEEADTGTLFLDEIGDVSLSVQVKLLRFLQSKEYKPLGSPRTRRADLRIVAATNKDLRAMVQRGEFREDLYYRLNIVPIQLPALHERKGDVPLLANSFLNRFKSEYHKDIASFSPAAMQQLVAYHWPGNVRELENKVQQAVVMAQGPVIELGDLLLEDELELTSNQEPSTFKEEKNRIVGQFELRYVSRLLEMYGGNISQAARHAGMDRKNLWSIMRKHGIDAHINRKRPRRLIAS